MDTAAIQVLLREAGYLRLRLPPELRSREAGTMIESGLKSLTGVMRVTLLTAEGKLAVRFDSSLTSHAAIALRLKALLAALPQAEAVPTTAESSTVMPEAGLAARLDDLREKFVTYTPERFRPLVESATTEKAVTNFFNDIVAFYLIKTHWDLITKLWIRDPMKYSNAWLTVFYMVFLLVRYRKS